MHGEIRALGDYVPIVHSERSEEIVKRMYEGKLKRHEEVLGQYNTWLSGLYTDLAA
jgi:hypothetical protein